MVGTYVELAAPSAATQRKPKQRTVARGLGDASVRRSCGCSTPTGGAGSRQGSAATLQVDRKNCKNVIATGSSLSSR